MTPTTYAQDTDWPGEPSLPAVLRERAGTEPVSEWRRARTALETVLVPEHLDRPVDTPFGPQPLGEFLDGFAVMEVLVHTWDLAQAVGVRTSFDPRVVRFVADRVEPMDEQIRGPVAFGPRLPAPAGADEVAGLMAFLGRAAESWTGSGSSSNGVRR